MTLSTISSASAYPLPEPPASPPSANIPKDTWEIYKEWTVDGVTYWDCKLTYPNGAILEAVLTDLAKITGKGKFTTIDQETYEGEFVDNLAQGYGTRIYRDKTVYVGSWKGGECHGQGTKTFADGDSFVGIWADDRMKEGTWKGANGNTYKGEFLDGLRHGKGTFTVANGEIYEGVWINDKLNGKGRIIYPDSVLEGTFINNAFLSDSSALGNSFFLKKLLGLGDEKFGISYTYPASVFSDYFLKNGHRELGAALTTASEINLLQDGNDKTKIRDKAREIQTQLSQGKPQFLMYGSELHSMGLNLIHERDSKFVFFEIFNSGDGLNQFHKRKDPSSRKYQTKFAVKAPIDNLTSDKIEKILCWRSFQTPSEAYREITSIEGAEAVEADPASAVWQTSQKTTNCSVEWIFAWLRNTKSKDDYDRLRLECFEHCLLQIKNKPEDSQKKRIVSVLNAKIEKRKKRLQASAAKLLETEVPVSPAQSSKKSKAEEKQESGTKKQKVAVS